MRSLHTETHLERSYWLADANAVIRASQEPNVLAEGRGFGRHTHREGHVSTQTEGREHAEGRGHARAEAGVLLKAAIFCIITGQLWTYPRFPEYYHWDVLHVFIHIVINKAISRDCHPELWSTWVWLTPSNQSDLYMFMWWFLCF